MLIISSHYEAAISEHCGAHYAVKLLTSIPQSCSIIRRFLTKLQPISKRLSASSFKGNLPSCNPRQISSDSGNSLLYTL